jgi:hypothetical protein
VNITRCSLKHPLAVRQASPSPFRRYLQAFITGPLRWSCGHRSIAAGVLYQHSPSVFPQASPGRAAKPYLVCEQNPGPISLSCSILTPVSMTGLLRWCGYTNWALVLYRGLCRRYDQASIGGFPSLPTKPRLNQRVPTFHCNSGPMTGLLPRCCVVYVNCSRGFVSASFPRRGFPHNTLEILILGTSGWPG